MAKLFRMILYARMREKSFDFNEKGAFRAVENSDRAALLIKVLSELGDDFTSGTNEVKFGAAERTLLFNLLLTVRLVTGGESVFVLVLNVTLTG